MSEKKRTSYKRGTTTSLPSHVDKKKYGYRWLNASKLAAASDGYESRGYEIDKDPAGQVTRRDDLILGRMPLDVFEEMKAQKDEDRLGQMALLKEHHAEQQAVQEHQLKKMGGRVQGKFELKQE